MPSWTKEDVVWLGMLKVGQGFIDTTYTDKPWKITAIDGDDVYAIDKNGYEATHHAEQDVIRAVRCPTCNQYEGTGMK